MFNGCAGTFPVLHSFCAARTSHDYPVALDECMHRQACPNTFFELPTQAAGAVWHPAGTLTTTRKAHISGLVSGLLAGGLTLEPEPDPTVAAARLQAHMTQALQEAAAQANSAAFSDRFVDREPELWMLCLLSTLDGAHLALVTQ